MSFKGNTAEIFNRLSRFEPFSKGLDALRRIPKDSSKTLPDHFPKENTSISIHQRLSSTESNFRSSLEGDLSLTYTKNTPNATKKYFTISIVRNVALILSLAAFISIVIASVFTIYNGPDAVDDNLDLLNAPDHNVIRRTHIKKGRILDVVSAPNNSTKNMTNVDKGKLEKSYKILNLSFSVNIYFYPRVNIALSICIS